MSRFKNNFSRHSTVYTCTTRWFRWSLGNKSTNKFARDTDRRVCSFVRGEFKIDFPVNENVVSSFWVMRARRRAKSFFLSPNKITGNRLADKVSLFVFSLNFMWTSSRDLIWKLIDRGMSNTIIYRILKKVRESTLSVFVRNLYEKS